MGADSNAIGKLREKIERAFAHREMPAVLPEQFPYIDSDAEDALWFNGRNWRSITCKDWQEHECAVTFLPFDAFRYYLQSLLILTIENPDTFPDLAIDSVIYKLDRTPDGGLDGDLADRFWELQPDEYEAIKEWLLYVCGYPNLKGHGNSGKGAGERFGRAFDTIDRLQKMAARNTDRDGSHTSTP